MTTTSPTGSSSASPTTVPITELPTHESPGFNDISPHPVRVTGADLPLTFRDADPANSRSGVLPSLTDLGLRFYMQLPPRPTWTVAFEPVTRQLSIAGSGWTRESTGPVDSTTGVSKRRRIEYPVGTGDAGSQALQRCIDQGHGAAEWRGQAMESIGAGRPRLNASTENDTSLYTSLRQLFEVGQSREARSETLHRINRLLGTGASLPGDRRNDPVLNGWLAHSFKIASVALAKLLWRVGTGSSNHSPGLFHRDGALATLFLSDGDVNNQLKLAAMLVETGCPLDGAGPDGTTALMVAARRNNLSAVQLLLNAGANVNLSNMDGQTALLMAAAQGNALTVKYLLGAQSDVDGRDHFGNTALLVAVCRRDELTVRLLLDANACVHLKYGENGETILNYAMQRGTPTMVQWLQEVGAEMTNVPHAYWPA